MVSLLNKGIQDIDSQLVTLGEKSYVTKELRYLMAKGKILPKSYRAGLVKEVMAFKAEDRVKVLRLLDKLSPQVDTQMHLNNVNAIKGMEMFMNADDTVKAKLAEVSRDIGNLYTELQGKNAAQRAAIVANASKKLSEAGSPVAPAVVALAKDEQLNEEVDNDKSRYLAHFKKLLSEGKTEELAAELEAECNKMAAKDDKEKEKEELAKEELARSEKEKDDKEKESLSTMKNEFQVMLQEALTASKEELVTLMNKSFDAHNVVLAKFTEDHKDVISLAKAVTDKVIETPTNQEK